MKRCYSGAENKDKSNFCPNCGASLKEAKLTSNHGKKLIKRFMEDNI